MEEGSTPPSKADPLNHTHMCGVKCMRRVDSRTQHGLPHIHPKVGSTVEYRWRVRAAGKPSDEPLRKGETQSLTAATGNCRHPRPALAHPSGFYCLFNPICNNSDPGFGVLPAVVFFFLSSRVPVSQTIDLRTFSHMVSVPIGRISAVLI